MSSSDYETTTVVMSQLNASVPNQNNVLQYALPSPLILDNNYEVAIASFYMYYSWPNITSNLSNNQLGYIFNGSTTNLTLPDGFYQISDLGNYIQQYQEAQGQYVLNNSGQQVTYGPSLVANQVYYKTTVSSTPIPTTGAFNSLTGWTNPNSIVLSGLTPQLVVPSGNMSTLLGVTSGTYPSPAQSGAYSVNGSFIPQISNVTSVNMSLNVIAPSFVSTSPQIALSFPSGGNTAYGALISISPPVLLWHRCQAGSFSTLQITLTDQSGNQLNNLDPQMSVTLHFRRKRKH